MASTGPPADPQVLTRVAGLLQHRGPDDGGILFRPHCGLVSRRLSILDLSSAGHQPMQADALPVWIAYNGEIYNFRDLRRQLAARGCNFRSHSDTEVILKGYVEWGDEVFARLRGMYALALWDERRQSLLLARDPFGIKPLYYAYLPDGGLAFGSELKAVLQFDGVRREISPTALGQYLRYLYVPEPLSIYEGIRRLDPGHLLRWSSGELQIKRQPGWMPLTAEPASAVEPQRAEEGVLRALRQSVAYHLVSDVPVGAFLSGGVDSSLMVAMMREATSAPVHTFSIIYSRRLKRFDESLFARAVAERLGTYHHEVAVDSSIVANLESMLDWFDEPFANPAALISGQLCSYTRQFVKVALSGVGGDELFGGYPRYLAFSWQRLAARTPAWLRRSLDQSLSLLPVSTDRKHAVDRLRRFMAAGLQGHSSTLYDDLSAFATLEQAAELVSSELLPLIAWRDPKRIPPSDQNIAAGWGMAADIASYLPGDLLTYTDRSSMRYSLEVRTPYLDKEVARVAMSLPEDFKVRGFQTKLLLKKLASRYAPRSAIYRGKKGFSVPLGDWLRHELRPMLAETLTLVRLSRVPELNPMAAWRLVSRHQAGDESVAYLVWALLVYVLWRERAAAGPGAQPSLQSAAEEPCPSRK